MRLQFDIQRRFKISYVIVEGASLLSIGAAIEPFAALQSTSAGRDVVLTMTTTGDGKQFAGGLKLAGEQPFDQFMASLGNHERPDMVFLICGFTVPEDEKLRLHRMVRLVLRSVIPLVLIGSATWAAAETGVLDGRRCSVHWKAKNALAENNPAIEVHTTIFQRDGGIITCPGETAALDVAMSILRENWGKNTYDELRNQFLFPYPRDSTSAQPGAAENRLHHYPPLLQAVVRDMGQNLEFPLPIDELASKYGISQRQLERIFARFTSKSPKRFYRMLQMEKARELCEQTDLPLSEIALACGFSNSGTASKHFRRAFGISPAELRKANWHASLNGPG